MSINRLFFVLLFVIVLALVDWYVFGAVRHWSQASPTAFRRSVLFIVGGLTIGAVLSIPLLLILSSVQGGALRSFLLLIIFTNLMIKLFMALFLLVDDLIRLGKRVFSRTTPPFPTTNDLPTIPRSDFLVQAAIVASTIPVIGVGYGILVGAHDYRVRRVKLALKNLPKSFDGLRIVQISDIHSGSFFNKRAVQGGVDMILREKPDVVFFTGDLVNNQAGEIEDYLPVFRRVKAPLGVFSILGNHDYGDYVNWESAQAKRQNLEKLIEAHRLLGWDLLLDEHRYLTQNGDRLAILGNQNWGTKFHRYGSLAKTHQGTEAPVKLLLSHDPSHWDAQVRPGYPDIDVMFAGHTHGAQFGIEISGFRWSPVQYVYQQWAGLYQEKTTQGRDQYLYVNRGFGYIGFPGRVGMPPEITVFELKQD